LQFLLGLLILRTKPGFIAFDWLGKQVQVSGSKEYFAFIALLTFGCNPQNMSEIV
jgi:hypothetical protein